MTSPVLMGEVADLELVADIESSALPYIELGSTGLRRVGGYVDEEFLPQLRGRKAVQVYREMGENDAITGALLYTIIQLLRNVDWPVVPAGKSREHANAAKYVESLMDDMSHTWDDFITEALTCLQYGWAWHEIVLKRRQGPWQRDGNRRSKYSDNLVGIKRLPIRSQETLQRWVFDETGGVKALVQMAPPDYQTRIIPLGPGAGGGHQGSLLFRYGTHKGNPEGRSLLRNSYRSWFYKKRLEEFESVGVERDLAGLPMVTVPSDYLRAGKATEQGKMVEAMKKMVRSVRRNEQEGLVFPAAYDRDTKQPLYKFELLGSGGARQFSTNELIQRYETRQLMTVLADFIIVGHQGSTGTYNLHVDKTGIFRAGVNSITMSISDVLNRHLIPRMFRINGWMPDELPTIQPTDVDSPDLTQLAGFMAQTANLGFTWGPDADMERYLRHAAGMPELGEDDYAQRRRLARKTQATMMAETQTAYLAAQSQLAQAQAETQMVERGLPDPEQAAEMAQAQMGYQQVADAKEQQSYDRKAGEQDRQLQTISTAVDLETKLRQADQPGKGSGNKPRGQAASGRKSR